MKCHFCKRAPHEISAIVDGANILKVSPRDYVRIDLETYHHETDLFCCSRCYINVGRPKIAELHHVFRNYRKNVIDLKEVKHNEPYHINYRKTTKNSW